MPRKNINRIKRFELDCFEKSLKKLLYFAGELHDMYGASAYFEVDSGWDRESCYILNYKALETHKEMVARLKRAKKTAAARDAKAAKQKTKDLQLLHKLLEKYPTGE